MIVPDADIANDIHAALDRMEASFGTPAIRNLLIRFGQQLADALLALDRGEAQASAHRIAGTAGTLGFTDLGRAWMALSDGVDSDMAEMRRQGAIARAVIAARTGTDDMPPTSV